MNHCHFDKNLQAHRSCRSAIGDLGVEGKQGGVTIEVNRIQMQTNVQNNYLSDSKVAS